VKEYWWCSGRAIAQKFDWRGYRSFVDVGCAQGAIPVQLATLGAAFLLIALVSDSTWSLAAGTARHWFARSPRRIAALSTTGGVMMIGLGGTLALVGNKN